MKCLIRCMDLFDLRPQNDVMRKNESDFFTSNITFYFILSGALTLYKDIYLLKRQPELLHDKTRSLNKFAS